MLKGGDSGLPAVVPKNPKRAFCSRLSLILITRLPCPQRAIVSPKSTSRLFALGSPKAPTGPGQMDKKLELKN
jgi:hypothetical protein